MSPDLRRSIVGAILVGIAAFGSGLGADAWLMTESVARDAVAAGIEAVVAALTAFLCLDRAQYAAHFEPPATSPAPAVPAEPPPRYPPEAS